MFQPLSKIEDTAPQFNGTFVQDHISVAERLKIYHNNVLGSLAKNILATYPMLEALVGENFLKPLAREFIIQNPPQSACLHYYGEGFDTFLKNHKATKNLPYLPDVAKMEWAMHKAYHAIDDRPLTGEDLSAIAPDVLPETSLTLRASVSFLSSPYPLEAIRKMCLGQSTDTPDMEKDHKTKLMIWRQDLEVNILPLGADEFTMLDNIVNQKTLGEALEKTLQSHPDFNIAEFLTKQINLETFLRI